MRLLVLLGLLLFFAVGSGAATAEVTADFTDPLYRSGFENSLCPNNVVEDAEQCDDNNTTVGDGCAANCRFFNCGDGLIDAPYEECDDGNQDPGDGCAGKYCLVESGYSCTGSPSVCTPIAVPDHLVINEIDYDQAGTDASSFIEIYNGSNETIALADLAVVLINGATNEEYNRFHLWNAGTSLAPGQYLVVRNTPVIVPVGTLIIDAAADFIQNGSPDGVALIDTVALTLLDALSYEGSITAASIDGFPAPVNLVENTAFPATDTNDDLNSLARSPNGTDTDNAIADWHLVTTITPGSANP